MAERKYKVGDEVLIKGVVTDVSSNDDIVYPYQILIDSDNTDLSWHDNFTETSIVGTVNSYVNEQSYKKGLEDAWEMARLIISSIRDGGLSTFQLQHIYGYANICDIGMAYSAQEAIDKYNTWKESIPVKGDVVDITGELLDRTINLKGIFYYYDLEKGECWVLLEDELVPQRFSKNHWTIKKIGGHVDIFGVLHDKESEE